MPNVTVARSKETTQLAREIWAAGDAPDFSAAIYKAAKLITPLQDFADAWDAQAGAQADESERYEADEDGPMSECPVCSEWIEDAVLQDGCPACAALELERGAAPAEWPLYVPSSLTPAERRAADKAHYMRATGVTPVRAGRFWFVPSRTVGGVIYRTTAESCSCKAGERNVPCWHRFAVGLEAELAA